MPLAAPSGSTLHYRLTIAPPGQSHTPGTIDPLSDSLFYVTSKYNADHPWIESPPEGDGQALDPASGRTEDGEYQVRVIDVPGELTALTCGLSTLVAEGNAGLTASYLSNGWVKYETRTGLTSGIGFGNTVNYPYLSGHILFGSGTYTGYIQKTFNGTEGGGTHWTPGQVVGVRFRVSWTLDTGPGNIFVEANGNHASFPNGSYDFWTIDPTLGPNFIVDNHLSAIADANGEVVIKLGGENYGGSCNVYAEFRNLAFFECDEVAVAASTDRYVTGWLADTSARQQLLQRPAWIEESTDGGVTWPTVLYAGYVKQITMEQSLTYLFTLGDAGRGRRVGRAWANLNPVEDFITS